MSNLTEAASIPIIVVIVFAAMELYKSVFKDKEKFIRIIPIIAALLGAILGIIAYYAAPEIIAADNILTAILIGGASGIAATGTHQIFKQLFKNSKTEEQNKEEQIQKEQNKEEQDKAEKTDITD